MVRREVTVSAEKFCAESQARYWSSSACSLSIGTMGFAADFGLAGDVFSSCVRQVTI